MIVLRELAGMASIAFVAMGAAMVLQSAGAMDARLPLPHHRIAAAAQPPTHSAITQPAIVHPVVTDVQKTAPAAVPATVPAPVRPIVEKPKPVETHPLPPGARAETALPPQAVKADPAALGEMAQVVAQRVHEKVPADLAPYFDIYIYVSKARASAGPWAQHMFVFHKKDDGTLVYEDSFAISTGRERQEKYFTATPAGLFELDPNRFVRWHRSATWNGGAMPWAMFFNYSYRTRMTGVALHGAIGREIPHLGSRASGGCVRMPMDKVEAMFLRLKNTTRGRVPVLAFDEARGTTNVRGQMMRDSAGNPILADGIKALVIIDTYPGHISANAAQS